MMDSNLAVKVKMNLNQGQCDVRNELSKKYDLCLQKDKYKLLSNSRGREKT